MAFDDALASRIRGHTGKRKGPVERRMFGGLAFLINVEYASSLSRT